MRGRGEISQVCTGTLGAPASERRPGPPLRPRPRLPRRAPREKSTDRAHGAEAPPLPQGATTAALREPHSTCSGSAKLVSNSPIRLSSNRDLISAILSRAFRRMLRVGRRERRGLDEAQSTDFLFCLQQAGQLRPALLPKTINPVFSMN